MHCLIDQPHAAALLSLAGGVMFCWGLLAAGKRAERRNFIYGRAPVLPVRVLAEHDDAWIRGDIRCEAPLSCPWFATPCVYYDYTIEKKVTRTHRDGKGRRRTSTSWVTEHHERKAIDFDLVDDGTFIVVQGSKAEFKHAVGTGTDYEWGSRRHSASLMPARANVWVLGVKQWQEAEGQVFSFLREIPLIVSTKGRRAFLDGGGSKVFWTRFFALFFMLLGSLGAGIFWVLQPTLSAGAYALTPGHGLAIAVIAFACWLPIWFWAAYNRFVRQNQMCEAAFRQIDVDLGVREAVIPSLVATVERYKQHEQELFERMAKLRAFEPAAGMSGRIERDAVAQQVSRRLIALSEAYPDLKADAHFMKLHDQLWALEEKLQASRTFYNDMAKDWNDLIGKIPSNIAAQVLRYTPRDYFQHLSDTA